MDVVINGEQCHLPDGLDLARLVHQIGLADKRIAIEVNERVIPASHHATYQLSAGDRIEIVHAIGGG